MTTDFECPRCGSRRPPLLQGRLLLQCQDCPPDLPLSRFARPPATLEHVELEGCQTLEQEFGGDPWTDEDHPLHQLLTDARPVDDADTSRIADAARKKLEQALGDSDAPGPWPPLLRTDFG